MFEITEIRFNQQKPISLDNSFVFIYGRNNVGKTVLLKAINYILGSSQLVINDLPGMNNIKTVECCIKFGEKESLFLKRDTDGFFYYKNDVLDPFLLVNRESYKEKIQRLFSAFDRELFDSYKQIVDERLSFRSVSYLNFIDQYSLGNSLNIIPQSNDIQFYKRINSQTLFFFDKETQEDLNKQKSQLKIINEKIAELDMIKAKKDFALKGIYDEFFNLSLPISDDFNELKKTYHEYRNNVVHKKNTIRNERELIYLSNASAKIASQIAIEQRLEKQSSLLSDRNKKIQSLLDFFKSVIGEKEEYKGYYNSIESMLEEIVSRDIVLSVKDYSKTIEALQKEKKSIDERIGIISRDLTEKSFLDISKSINNIERYLSLVNTLPAFSEYESLMHEKNEIQKKIDYLNKKARNLETTKLVDEINRVYYSMPNDISFVSEDRRRGVRILYYPMTRSLKGEENSKGLTFNPGSKARQLCWQVIALICIHSFIKKEYPAFPLMPLLVIDGFNEPFDDDINAFETICHFFGRLCKEKGIQFIVSSSKMINEKEGCKIVDVSDGVNKEFRK